MKRTALLATIGLVATANVFAPQQCVLAQGSQSNPFHSGTNPFHQNNPFHNHSSKNGPNVVAALCSDQTGNSAKFVSKKGKFVLVLTGDNKQFGESTFSGWEVFTSHPGVNPGNISPSTTTTAPAGTYSFTVSGLPSSGSFGVEVNTVDALGNHGFSDTTISNGKVTVVAPADPDSGSPIVAVYFWIFIRELSAPPLPTLTVSNFMLNGKPLGIDTTHKDDNPETKDSFFWCERF
jgi:hypothetical protein